mmetsp:Transcript_83835/g.233886  ORF Transcript_83835/g.233886 Transcript_83835/m.233886 type:complete len:787 (-) Transcript_83835:257-2617(-)
MHRAGCDRSHGRACQLLPHQASSAEGESGRIDDEDTAVSSMGTLRVELPMLLRIMFAGTLGCTSRDLCKNMLYGLTILALAVVIGVAYRVYDVPCSTLEATTSCTTLEGYGGCTAPRRYDYNFFACNHMWCYVVVIVTSVCLALFGCAQLTLVSAQPSRRGPEVAWFFPFLLILCAAGGETLGTRVMTIIGNFYGALSSTPANVPLFYRTIWQSFFLCSAIALCKGLLMFATDASALQWRRSIVSCMQAQYFERHRAYDIMTGVLQAPASSTSSSVEGGEPLGVPFGRAQNSSRWQSSRPFRAGGATGGRERIDNPDQRITQDVDLFTSAFAELVASLVVIPVLVVYYTWYLWTNFNWMLPAFCYLYFALGAIMQGILVKRVVRFVYLQERYEGNFRFDHLWFRTHVEAVAFLRGEALERVRISAAFARAVGNKHEVIRRQLPIGISSNWMNYMGSVMNYAAVGASLLWLSDVSTLSPGEVAKKVSQGSFSCLYLINAFSTTLDAAEKLSNLGGLAGRLSEAFSVLGIKKRSVSLRSAAEPERWACAAAGHSVPEFRLVTRAAIARGVPLLTLCDVTLQAPDSGSTLIRGLNLSVHTGRPTLVVGPSGCGKTSLMRAMAGLWPLPLGSIVTNVSEDLVAYSPQEPYTFRGSLLAQVTYPRAPPEQDTPSCAEVIERLADLLRLLELHYLHDHAGWHGLCDWTTRLSPGERQRLAVVRLLLSLPTLAVLDEATSAVDEAMEALIYRALQDRGVTVMSVGHRQTLERFHCQKLTIVGDGSGGWQLEPI